MSYNNLVKYSYNNVVFIINYIKKFAKLFFPCKFTSKKINTGGNMATFSGTIQEFHNFIGPRIRNCVNIFVKNVKNEQNGICSSCKKHAPLEAAHQHGKDRKLIISKVQDNYLTDGRVEIDDISFVENQILEMHKPIQDTFIFLCRECHIKYDNRANKSTNRISDHTKKLRDNDHKKLGRLDKWAKNPNQNNHKIIQIFRKLEKIDGYVKLETLKSEVERNEIQFCNFNSLKTDSGHSHGKVFFVDEDNYVKLFPLPRTVIEQKFPAV